VVDAVLCAQEVKIVATEYAKMFSIPSIHVVVATIRASVRIRPVATDFVENWTLISITVVHVFDRVHLVKFVVVVIAPGQMIRRTVAVVELLVHLVISVKTIHVYPDVLPVSSVVAHNASIHCIITLIVEPVEIRVPTELFAIWVPVNRMCVHCPEKYFAPG
jgi:hypothetical protein